MLTFLFNNLHVHKIRLFLCIVFLALIKKGAKQKTQRLDNGDGWLSREPSTSLA